MHFLSIPLCTSFLGYHLEPQGALSYPGLALSPQYIDITADRGKSVKILPEYSDSTWIFKIAPLQLSKEHFTFASPLIEVI